MILPQTVKFLGADCRVKVGVYQHIEAPVPALQLLDDGNDLVAVATLNVEGRTPPEGHCYIKDYSENKGMTDALEAAGIVERTGVQVSPSPAALVTVPLCKIIAGPDVLRHIDDAYLEMRQQHARDDDDESDPRPGPEHAREKYMDELRETSAKQIGSVLMADDRIDMETSGVKGTRLSDGRFFILWLLDGAPIMMSRVTNKPTDDGIESCVEVTARVETMAEQFPDHFPAAETISKAM